MSLLLEKISLLSKILMKQKSLIFQLFIILKIILELRTKVKVIIQVSATLNICINVYFIIKYFISEITKERNNPNAKIKNVSAEAKSILDELERDYKPTEESKKTEKPKADKFNSVCYFYIQHCSL